MQFWSDYIIQSATLSSFGKSAITSFVILSDIEKRIKEKIEQVGIPLKDWNINIYRGILTGYNEAFIIDGKTKDRLIEKSPKNAEIIRPILRGRDIKRYGYEFADLWLISVHNGTETTAAINIEDYPDIKEYLDQYLPQLIKREDKGYTPYNLRSCAYMDDFSKRKIGWGNLALNCQFAIIGEGYFVNAPSAFFCTEDLYLLAILNSSTSNYYIKSLGVTRNGGYFEYKPMFVEKMPIPQIPESNKDIFIELVNEIEKNKNNSQKKNLLEKRINELAFQLYGLTKEEIMFIESL